MDDIATLIDESKEILRKFHQESMTEPTKRITTEALLREDVMSFVSGQMRSIEKQDSLRALVEKELMAKILLHELSTDDLLAVYKSISTEKSKNTDVLLSLFKPSGMTPSTLMLPPTKGEEENEIELTSAQRQSIDKLSRLVTLLSANSNKESDEIKGEIE